jgi:hypothetical protein
MVFSENSGTQNIFIAVKGFSFLSKRSYAAIESAQLFRNFQLVYCVKVHQNATYRVCLNAEFF